MLTMAAVGLIATGSTAMAQSYGIGGAGQVTSDEAQTIVMEVIGSSMADYSLSDMTAFVNPRGRTIYSAEVTDSAGNKYIYYVGPNGHISEPGFLTR